jgi:hypothetical protein
MHRSVIPFLIALSASGAAETSEQSVRYPGSAGPSCSYVSLESDSSPTHENVDSVMLVALGCLSPACLRRKSRSSSSFRSTSLVWTSYADGSKLIQT